MNKVIIEICLPEARINGVNNTIKAGLFNIWTAERIKGAFNNSKGTMKDFNRYKKDNNNRYCLIKEIEKDTLKKLYPNADI